MFSKVLCFNDGSVRRLRGEDVLEPVRDGLPRSHVYGPGVLQVLCAGTGSSVSLAPASNQENME